MTRFLVAAALALALASCAGGRPAGAPYDGNCTEYTCDGHLLTY
jgi:hypothetical protein